MDTSEWMRLQKDIWIAYTIENGRTIHGRIVGVHDRSNIYGGLHSTRDIWIDPLEKWARAMGLQRHCGYLPIKGYHHGQVEVYDISLHNIAPFKFCPECEEEDYFLEDDYICGSCRFDLIES